MRETERGERLLPAAAVVAADLAHVIEVIGDATGSGQTRLFERDANVGAQRGIADGVTSGHDDLTADRPCDPADQRRDGQRAVLGPAEDGVNAGAQGKLERRQHRTPIGERLRVMQDDQGYRAFRDHPDPTVNVFHTRPSSPGIDASSAVWGGSISSARGHGRTTTTRNQVRPQARPLCRHSDATTPSTMQATTPNAQPPSSDHPSRPVSPPATTSHTNAASAMVGKTTIPKRRRTIATTSALSASLCSAPRAKARASSALRTALSLAVEERVNAAKAPSQASTPAARATSARTVLSAP